MSSLEHNDLPTLLEMAGNCRNIDQLKLFCRMLLGQQIPPATVLTNTSIRPSTSKHSGHSCIQDRPSMFANTVVPSTAGNMRFQNWSDQSSVPYSINQTSVLPVYTATEEYTIDGLPPYTGLPPYAVVLKSKILKHYQFGATPKYREFRKAHTPLEVLKYKMICHFTQCSHLFEGTVPTHEDQLLFVAFDGLIFRPVRCNKVLRSDIVRNGHRGAKTPAEEIEYLYIQIQIKKRTLQTLYDYDKSVLIVQNVLNSIEVAINCGIPNKQALDKHKTLFKETWKLYFPEPNETIKPKKKLKRKNHENDGDGQSNNDANAGDDGWPDDSNTGGGSSGQSHGFSGEHANGGGTGCASLQNHLHTCKENDSSHDSDESSTDDSLPRWKHGSSDSDESEDEESDGDSDDDDDNEDGMPKIESGKSGPCSKSSPIETMSNADDQDPLYNCQVSLETMHLNPSDDFETTKSLVSKTDEGTQASQQVQKGADFEVVLIDAAKNGDLLAVIECVKKGVDVSRHVGRNALHCASSNGHLEVVKYLNETCHVDKEAKDNIGWTGTGLPVHYASKNGHLDVVKYFIETCHVDKEAKDFYGWTALQYAISNGHLEVVRYLVETCHVDTEAKDGWTALHCASWSGHLEVVKYLIETCHGDKEAKNNKGSTALHHASNNGHLEVVRYLIETCHVDTEAKDDDGWTALHCASSNGHLEVVKYLIETCHVDKEATENDGRTALHRASFNGHLEVVKYLIETCHVDTEAKVIDGWTALHCASFNGHLEVVQYLIETCNVDMEVNDIYGQTALHCASSNGHLEVVKYLIETYHVDKEATENDGRTALHRASYRGHLEVVKYLIETCSVDKDATPPAIESTPDSTPTTSDSTEDS